jgi:hypothetical protein
MEWLVELKRMDLSGIEDRGRNTLEMAQSCKSCLALSCTVAKGTKCERGYCCLLGDTRSAQTNSSSPQEENARTSCEISG